MDCGSITAAAAHLLVTQAAVSKAVAEIEAALDIKMFERHGRNLRPTVAGQRFIEAARKISFQINNLGEGRDLIADGGGGILRVGVQTITAHRFLVETITKIGKQHPESQIQLRDGHLGPLIADLMAGRLDAVFGRLIPSVIGTLPNVPMLYTEPSAVVASVGHPVLEIAQPRWPDLLLHPWALPLPETPLREHFDLMVSKQLLGRPKCLFETTSVMTMQVMLEAMPLLTLLPISIARRWDTEGQGVMMQDMILLPQTEPIGLVWAPESHAAPLLRLLQTELTLGASVSAFKYHGIGTE